MPYEAENRGYALTLLLMPQGIIANGKAVARR